MNIFKKSSIFIALTSLIVSFNLVTIAPVMALSDQSAQSDVCTGIGEANGTGTTSCATNGSSGLNNIIQNVIEILALIVGVAAIIMVIVGGFKYIVSSGDSNATSSAKNTIIYALVGLVIAALAETLVHFVLFRATGIGK